MKDSATKLARPIIKYIQKSLPTITTYDHTVIPPFTRIEQVQNL